MHILIIEDEEQLCRSVAEGLRIDGYETDICFDGDEGLCLCMTENYDLILLDLNLPGTDGLEILRQFREHNTNTPVLILSARDQIEDKVNGLDLGANDYLTKPFHFQELEARIRSLTRRKFVQEDVCLKWNQLTFDTRTRETSVNGVPISLTEISRIAMFDPKYFCRFFKKCMGTTFLEYQNDIRISHIYQDLVSTNDKIFVIPAVL